MKKLLGLLLILGVITASGCGDTPAPKAPPKAPDKAPLPGKDTKAPTPPGPPKDKAP